MVIMTKIMIMTSGGEKTTSTVAGTNPKFKVVLFFGWSSRTEREIMLYSTLCMY